MFYIVCIQSSFFLSGIYIESQGEKPEGDQDNSRTDKDFASDNKDEKYIQERNFLTSFFYSIENSLTEQLLNATQLPLN